MRALNLLIGACASLAAIKAWGDASVREYESLPLEATTPPGELVEVEGLRLHYLDRGAGPPLVLLHGLAATTTNWRLTIPRLSERFRVIAIDLAGHGLSTRSAPDLSLTAHARYVAGLLDHLGIERASVVGHSMGGSIAQRFAIMYPERLDRLVLIASTTDDYMLRAAWAAPVLAPFIPAFLTAVVHNRVVRERELRLLVHDASHITPEIKAEYAAPGHIKGHARSFKRLMVDRVKDQRLDLSKIGAPTLILWGDRDRLVSVENGRRLERRLPNARLTVIPHAGHLLPEEQPDAVNEAILEFLDSRTPGLWAATSGTAASPGR